MEEDKFKHTFMIEEKSKKEIFKDHNLRRFRIILKTNRKNKKRSLNPHKNNVDINNSDTLDCKKPTLKVCDY